MRDAVTHGAPTRRPSGRASRAAGRRPRRARPRRRRRPRAPYCSTSSASRRRSRASLQHVLPATSHVAVLDHLLAPLRAEPIDRAQREPRLAGRRLEPVARRSSTARTASAAASSSASRGSSRSVASVTYASSAPPGRRTRAHSASPRRTSTCTSTSRHQIQSNDASSNGISSIAPSTTSISSVSRAVGDALARERAVHRQRVERDRSDAVLAHEPDRVDGVARARVEHEVSASWAELGEHLEEPVCAARVEAPPERVAQLGVAGPELVELLNRRHQPPAIAGSRITVEASPTRRVEALARAHVLALDVDVHERRDPAVVQDARAERGEARRRGRRAPRAPCFPPRAPRARRPPRREAWEES